MSTTDVMPSKEMYMEDMLPRVIICGSSPRIVDNHEDKVGSIILIILTVF